MSVTPTPSTPIPPIDPQNVIDIIFSATFFTASDSRGQKLGKRFLIDYFNSLKLQNKQDKVATAYLNAIEPIVGSALRAFSVEKLNYKRKILPLERLSIGEEAAINEHIGIIPLLSVAKATSKWSILLYYSLFGLLGGSIAVALNIHAELLKLTAYAVASASLSIILFSSITRTIKAILIKNLIKRTSKQLDIFWDDSYKRYETILIDALISSIRLKELCYPDIHTFHDGHLFPRQELPYFQLSNSEMLSPSNRSLNELIDELISIVQARMSIRPGTDRVAWLKSRVKKPNAS